MNAIFELFGKIVIDNDDADRAIDKTTKKATNAKNSLQTNFAKIGKAAISCGKAIITAGIAIGGALVNIANQSREYRTEMGKLLTAFAVQNFSADAAKSTYKDLIGVLGETDTAVEAAQHIAQLARNEEELHNWTNICTGVFATFGDSLPVESLMEASNETAKTGTVTGTLADALNWAGIEEEKFNKHLAACTSESERQNLIMTTLNQTYGEAAQKYKDINKDVIEHNQAQDRLNAAWAGLGEAVEPAVTALINNVARLVEEVTPAVEGVCSVVESLSKAWENLDVSMSDISAAINISYNPMAQTLNMAEGIYNTTSALTGAVIDSVHPDSPNKDTNFFANLLTGILGFSTGLDYVPYNNMPAFLHYGEAVLTREDAAAWRNGRSGDVEVLASRLETAINGLAGLLQQIAGNTGAGQNIVLDSGALVGQLTPGINAQMGAITKRRGRRS